ncbi:hypothetical protein A3F86_00600 [candidate division WOR-1 bacterium RIFCSPLOWO2_12_FULL_45_9]|uniref:histidine kinase n=1 Tax=candidate division WOR-1 bacterium RIFCSPLOWO2_12_FULL_45_9 TaxID=1802568 RepID=A0A1F4RMD6_UNCSA|nr:MAG: hypothetical protein A3F86_00600 [candidate division WOR-1 bacterium RIFCSPLOWO2_12_FULL_45_9]
MNFFSVFSLLNGALNLSLGLIVFFRKSLTAEKILFFLFTLSIFIWNIGYALMYRAADLSRALSYAKLGTLGIILIPLFANLFVVNVLEKKERLFTAVTFIYASMLVWLLVTNGFYSSVNSYSWGNYPVADGYNYLNIIFFVFLFLKISFQLGHEIFIVSGADRLKMLYLMVAFAIGFFGFIDWIPNYYSNFYPIAFFLSSSWVFILAYAITKHRLMNISVIISKTLAWVLTIFFLGSVYAAMVWLHLSFISSQITAVFFAVTIIYGIIVGNTFQRVRLFLQTTADKAFVKGWYDFPVVVRKAASSLGRALTRQDIVKAIQPILLDDLDIAQLQIYFFDESNKKYLEWDPEAETFNNKTVDSSLLARILDRKDVVRLENGLGVPAFAGNDLAAIILLGKKRSEDEYTDDDLELFRTIGDYTAIALEYIVKPYEEVKTKFEATRSKLVEAEKNLERAQRLSSLGRIIAEVAHEIRNPLTVINSRAQKIKRKNSDPAYVSESADLMLQNCEQIKKVAAKMYTLSQPQKYELAGVDTGEVINKALEAMSPASDIKTIKGLNAAALVMGNKEDLTRVFINLFTNAYDAMREKGGTLKIQTQEIKQNEANYVKIEVSDTGRGIAKEVLPEVFEPFFTTKFGKLEERMGFGLTICHDIVCTKHSGSINVESAPGKGTKFTILLPAQK